MSKAFPDLPQRPPGAPNGSPEPPRAPPGPPELPRALPELPGAILELPRELPKGPVTLVFQGWQTRKSRVAWKLSIPGFGLESRPGTPGSPKPEIRGCPGNPAFPGFQQFCKEAKISGCGDPVTGLGQGTQNRQLTQNLGFPGLGVLRLDQTV